MKQIIKITRSAMEGVVYFVAIRWNKITTTCYAEKATIYTNITETEKVIHKLQHRLKDYYIEAVDYESETNY